MLGKTQNKRKPEEQLFSEWEAEIDDEEKKICLWEEKWE